MKQQKETRNAPQFFKPAVYGMWPRCADDIDPNLYYISSHLTQIKTSDGVPVGSVAGRLRRQGRLHAIPNPPHRDSFGYLGEHILSIMAQREVVIKDEDQLVSDFIASIPPKQLKGIVLRHIQSKGGPSVDGKLRRKIEKMEEEIFFLQQRVQTRDALIEKKVAEEASIASDLAKAVKDLLQKGVTSLRLKHLLNGSACGVYVLLNNGSPVYVGQSVSILSRLGQHAIEKSGKFDDVRYMPCNRDQLNTLEKLMINLLMPELNVAKPRQFDQLSIIELSKDLMRQAGNA